MNARWSIAAIAVLAAGCTAMQSTPSDPATDYLRKTVQAGIRAYDEGQYVEAGALLRHALNSGPPAAKDQATANKYLAFIYCSNQKVAQCDAAFRAAIQADPDFMLTPSEQGHPLWGPVFRRIKRP